MLTANLKSGLRVSAQDAYTFEGPFFCPACSQQVQLRSGSIRIDYFEHEMPTQCEYSGESEGQLKMKLQLFDYLKGLEKAGVKAVQLEQKVQDIRPDVQFEFGGKQVGIEVQAPGLSAEQILERTRRYCQLGIYLLWVLPYDYGRFYSYNKYIKRHVQIAFPIKDYEKVIAQMNFNSLIFWDIDLGKRQGFIAYQVMLSAARDNSYLKGGEEITLEALQLKGTKAVLARKYNVDLLSFQCRQVAPLQTLSYELPRRALFCYVWGGK